MSQGRDDSGQFTETATDQQLLKVFDYEDDPVLTTTEVADGLQRFGVQLSSEAVRRRLHELEDEGSVSRKEFGARAVGWWATVAPELDPAVADRIDRREGSKEWETL
ncbi:winged-helix domain-containing protein [Salinarchaeum laminariae]|uniref:winged-helix domain-containing protein n=1 Tax=Salinarchaeum laminariae TaxID=869888 RepID=UPI0020C053E9|nr:winged-helix domain-containing protein [Salinarchaeum laminariae]